MQKLSGLLSVLVMALAVASCGGGGAAAGPGGGGGGGGGGGNCPAATFCMTAGNAFSPTSRTVAVGATVTWQNDTGTFHNVTWDDAAGRNAAAAGDGSGDITQFSSGSHTRVFGTAGTYGFKCTIHPGMNG